MDKYILWLPSWYPNRLSAFDGDFIQRHAMAAAAFHSIHVVHFVRDTEGRITKDVWVEETQTARLRETIVYYHTRHYPLWLADRFLSWRRFNSLFRNFFDSYFQQYGKPSFMHVHVAFKAGSIALYLQKAYTLYYLLTEHWTIYLQEAHPGFSELPKPIQRRIDRIVRNARLVLPVSFSLKTAMLRRWPGLSCQVFPNVVDPALFHVAEKKEQEGVLRLIHISTMVEQKNPEAMLEGLHRFTAHTSNWRMDVFGPSNANVLDICKKLGLETYIHFHGEHPQAEVGRALQQSDVLLLFSRYENQPCVILEAFACGIPVIVSDIPAHRELVEEGVTGLFADPNDPQALADQLKRFALNKGEFKAQQIVDSAKPFLKENVQSNFRDLYAPYL